MILLLLTQNLRYFKGLQVRSDNRVYITLSDPLEFRVIRHGPRQAINRDNQRILTGRRQGKSEGRFPFRRTSRIWLPAGRQAQREAINGIREFLRAGLTSRLKRLRAFERLKGALQEKPKIRAAMACPRDIISTSDPVVYRR
jgi:hypothetical protein